MRILAQGYQCRLAILAMIVVVGISAAQTPPEELSRLVFPRPDGRLQYAPAAANGDVIPDFSNAGYMGGGAKLPDAPVKATIAPDPKSHDDTARIQHAIDDLAKLPQDKNGIRGALLLKRGKYRIEGQLKIEASGIVVRGEGDGEDGTVLIAAGKKQRDLIDIKGRLRRDVNEKSRAKITDSYVPVGAKSFDVVDASSFHVGDTVLVHRIGNADWIHFIKMDQITPRPGNPTSTKQWQPFELNFDRVITRIDGHHITVDASITCSIDAKWGGGAISRYTDNRIEQVGVENLRGDSEFDSSVIREERGEKYAADEDHAMYLLSFDNVKNAWARKLSAVHFYHGVEIAREQSKWLTVEDCSSIDPVSVITGGRRYPFCTCGQLILVQRCYSRDGRHAFVVQARVCGPNVFLDCRSENDHATSEPHHRWSVGGLYDNVHAHMALQDRQYMGSGHGWAGANYVMWNCEGTLVCQRPPTAQNYAIGFVGQKTKGAFDRPDGYWESFGKHVEPRSLYLKQLEDRLGKQAVAAVARVSNPCPDGPATPPVTGYKPVLQKTVSRSYDNAGETASGPTLENDHLRIKLLDDNRIRIEPKKGGWAAVGKLCDEVLKDKPETRLSTHRDPLGDSPSIELTAKSGSKQEIWLAPNLPFICTSVSLCNPGATPLVLSELTPLSCELETTSMLAGLRLFASDGLSNVKSKGSYVFLAVVDPKTRAGLVGGWLTHERGSGIVLADVQSNGIQYNARTDYGRLTIAPGQTAQGETFAMGFFDDARDGLESLADEIAKANDIHLPPPYCGYSTWYHAHASDEKHMARLAKFAHNEKLSDFGLNFMQIDDQWQASRRDFTDFKHDGPYPSGMKATADAIEANGFFAGLWLTPFGWDRNIPALKDHPDWFVHKTDGSIYDVKWAGDCLDMSNPAAREFLSSVIKRITHDWNYRLLKLDGLWSGMACTILYPDPTYRDDNLGDAVFHDPSRTNEEVYRDGLRLVREAAGKDAFLLGCNIAQNMRTLGGSIGLVDSMRVGPDIGASWSKVVRCAKPATWLYFLNGRVWWNDPDCIMLRYDTNSGKTTDPLSIDNARAWASFVAMSGELNLVSESLPDLPKERLEIYKRTLPNAGHPARPVDLFERDLPRLWHLKWADGDDAHDVVALYNWSPASTTRPSSASANEEPIPSAAGTTVATDGSKMSLDLSQLGLPADQEFVGFDYWSNEFISAFKGSRQFEVPPGSCRVIALKRVSNHPEVIGTSRHVTQGAADVLETSWDGADHTLSGRSKVIGGDDYEIRIHSGVMHARKASVTVNQNATTVETKQEGPFVRVLLHPQQTGEVNWAVRFAESDR